MSPTGALLRVRRIESVFGVTIKVFGDTSRLRDEELGRVDAPTRAAGRYAAT